MALVSLAFGSQRHSAFMGTTLTDADRDLIVKNMAIPSGYASIRLGIDLLPQHKECLDALFSKDNQKLSFVLPMALARLPR